MAEESVIGMSQCFAFLNLFTVFSTTNIVQLWPDVEPQTELHVATFLTNKFTRLHA